MVAGLADQVMVMYAGRQVEMGTTDEIFYESRHPYTLGLLASLPRLDDVGEEPLRAHRRVAALAHPPPRRAAPSTRGAGSPGSRACATRRCPSCASWPATRIGPRATTPRPSPTSPWTACGRDVDEAELVVADGFVAPLSTEDAEA